MGSETFIFFGIVGSGKGTQVELLTKYLEEKTRKEVVYAGPGKEYRRLISSGSYTGKLIEESMQAGNLQPDFLTNAIVTNIMINEVTPEKHLVLDGYPRTTNQSESLEKKFQFFKRDSIKIIYIELSREEAMKRNLLRGRADDTEEGINKRFDEYVNNVIPAMNYFKDKSGYQIFTINGQQSVEDVHKDIIKALGY